MIRKRKKHVNRLSKYKLLTWKKKRMIDYEENNLFSKVQIRINRNQDRGKLLWTRSCSNVWSNIPKAILATYPLKLLVYLEQSNWNKENRIIEEKTKTSTSCPVSVDTKAVFWLGTLYPS